MKYDFEAERKKADQEFQNQIAALFICMFVAIILIGYLLHRGGVNYKEEMERDGCVLIERIFDKADYCGKACFQDMYFHTFSCSVSNTIKTDRRGAIRWTKAIGRDDYITKHQRK